MALDVTTWQRQLVNLIPSGTLDITENGEYDVSKYATADVSVSGLVPTGTIEITENGEYNVTQYAAADVNVSGNNVVMGVLRPDAELVQKWTYDKMIVADEHVTLPAYSTTAQTLKASASLISGVSLDFTQYDYLLLVRGICKPVYSSNTIDKGRFEYSISVGGYEILCIPKNIVKIGNTTSSVYDIASKAITSSNISVYWSSGSALNVYDVSNGPYMTIQILSPSINSANGTGTLNYNSPALMIKGSTSYFTSTFWDYLTDIRYQYIVELWKVPHDENVSGWSLTSQAVHAVKCAQSESGTLS